MAKVVYTDASGIEREKIVRVALTIGRGPDQHLQILDRVVSKEHAIVESDGVHSFLVDNASRNGTLLNGQPITGRVALRDGDRIRIGSNELLFRDDAQIAERSRHAVRLVEEGGDSAVRRRLKEEQEGDFVPSNEIDDPEQLRRDYEKLRIAHLLSRALAREVDPENVLRLILEQALALFGADRGAILLADPETGEMAAAVYRTRTPSVDEGHQLRIPRTILREVVELRHSVLSNDAQMDSRFGGAQSIIISGIRASMTVPLTTHSRVLGVIHLDTRLATDTFTEKDLQLLNGFAHQAAAAIEASQLIQKSRNEALAREKLGRLLPQELVDDVMAGRVDVQRGGKLCNATVLFSDIRGFTAMSERLPAQEIVGMLNEYFEVMVEIIFKYGGTLDKFVGDEIMAVWGAPIEIPDHCVRAVRAAVEMQAAVEAFNARRVAAGHVAIHSGIGVNTGELVAGYMGSSRAMDYTVIGDVVNTGSRLCSAAAGGEVIVSEAVVHALQGALVYEELEARELKGKREAVRLFRAQRVLD